MKKFTIALLIFCLAGVSSLRTFAQLEKNTWMLLGYSALWYQAGKQSLKNGDESSDGAKLMNLYLRTGAGYFVMANMAAGLALNWEYNREKSSAETGEDIKNITNFMYFGPFLRYYFFQRNALWLYGEALFAIGVYKSIYKHVQESTSTQNLIKAHLLVGMSYFLVQRLAIDLALGYSYARYKYKDSESIQNYNQFMACVGLVFFLGQNGGYGGVSR